MPERRDVRCQFCGGFIGYAIASDGDTVPAMYHGPCWERFSAAAADEASELEADDQPQAAK